MSKSKDPTEPIRPSSSAESTEEKAEPSRLSASSESTPGSTLTSKTQSPSTSSSDKGGLTTLPTTVVITEKARQHAMLARVTLKQLEKVGLIRRFKVLSKDATTVERIRIEFDLAVWTEELELK